MKNIVLVIALAMAVAPAHAADAIDQANGSGTLTGAGTVVGQSFTPTAASFDFVTFRLDGNAANPNRLAQVAIYAGSGFDGTLMGISKWVELQTGGADDYRFIFETPITLASGALYSFRIAAAVNNPFTFVYSGQNPYAGGTRLTGTGVAVTAQDLVFSQGLQAVAAVPEPATWAMLIAGFGVIGRAMRRRELPARRALRVC